VFGEKEFILVVTPIHPPLGDIKGLFKAARAHRPCGQGPARHLREELLACAREEEACGTKGLRAEGARERYRAEAPG
jgi:hypothetical protein